MEVTRRPEGPSMDVDVFFLGLGDLSQHGYFYP